MTWNHKRGINPLVAASEAFMKKRLDVKITWDSRSLEDFEDYPIDKLANSYDMILLDHPCIGTGVTKQALEPLNQWISTEFLSNQKKNSVGGSYESYTWEGRQWALPIDAASQVSAYRQDLFTKVGLSLPPVALEEIDNLITFLPSNYQMGIPLNPTHSFLSFITISANIGGADFYKEGKGFKEEIGIPVLQKLKKWKEKAHPISIDSNPIQILDYMTTTNEILYVPFIFGYSNYGRNQSNIIRFANIPSAHSKPSGSILGGVGIALSSKSKHKQESVQFMEYVTSEDCQCGVYLESDGQPAYRKAWLMKESNDRTNDFFSNTLQSMDLSYIRPRYYGYVEFQKRAGELIHHFLKKYKEEPSTIIQQLNQLHSTSLLTTKED